MEIWQASGRVNRKMLISRWTFWSWILLIFWPLQIAPEGIFCGISLLWSPEHHSGRTHGLWPCPHGSFTAVSIVEITESWSSSTLLGFDLFFFNVRNRKQQKAVDLNWISPCGPVLSSYSLSSTTSILYHVLDLFISDCWYVRDKPLNQHTLFTSRCVVFWS